MVEYAVIFIAGLLAGMMNALAGGGSFVSLPALIAAGLPSVQANASSTVALLPGSAASAWVYRDGLGPIGAVSLRTLLMITLVGGVLGAMLLLWTPSKTFDVILPWLLLLALIMLIFGQRIGAWLRRHERIGPGTVMVAQFGLGIYGGYFGGAVGLMMMAVWGLMDAREIKSLNAPRTFLVSATNLMAVITFIVAGAVRWPETLVMLIASVVGGYVGARLGRVAPPHWVRTGTLILTSLITLVFFLRTYGRPAAI